MRFRPHNGIEDAALLPRRIPEEEMKAMATLPDTPYADDESRWCAVRDRDTAADDRFWYAVATTGVYCRPSCAARPARRENVSFYDSRVAAEAAGFRPCRRCRPDLPPRRERLAATMAEACRRIDGAEEEPRLADLAAAAGMSPHHFHRLFREIVGVTPKQYAAARRAGRVGTALRSGESVTAAIYDAGYNASSRFYESAPSRLGMTATAVRRGGQGETIRHAAARGWLGLTLVAATERGVCAILFGDDEADLQAELGRRFPKAALEPAEPGSPYQAWIDRTLAYLEAPSGAPDLPLDVAGTAFQERVWRALREIPEGETRSYADVAAAIGAPKAVRAAANACAANPVAVVIPCHRVLRSDGGIGGYHWGEARKRKLLARERAG